MEKRATYAPDPAMLQALNNQLQGEVARLRAEVTRLQTGLPQPIEPPTTRPARPGYWVITPSPYYSETYLGLAFTRGQAFIPEGEGAAEQARRLADELGYCVLYTPDYPGPLTRPDITSRPVEPPPEKTTRQEWVELFRGGAE